MGISTIGGGISVFNGGMPANPHSLASLNAQVEVVTLDSIGQGSVPLSNADGYYGIAGMQESTGFQSGIGRITPTDSFNINFQADAQGAAENKTAAIIYWKP